MSLRRGLLAQMASGKQFISGTVTATGTSCTISFGKSYSNYLFLVEMTADSKSELMDSGRTNVISFAWFGIHPERKINNIENGAKQTAVRIKPATSEMSNSISGGTMTDSSISFNVADLSATSPTSMRTGYSYNYTIVSLD